jgi:REP element-mobilizing transposase RayT
MSRPRKKWLQQDLPTGKRGGKRKNAGRKRLAPRPQVKHRVRPEVKPKTPVHITLRMLPGVARLRRRDQYRAIRQALARVAHEHACRICHYSIQGNHIHLIVEPDGKAGLVHGMIAFKTSCARRLNRIVGRDGRVFADRYHARYLTSCAQVRRALCYVLNNWRRHGEHRAHPEWRTDPFSSADFFDGWTGYRPGRPFWLGPEDTPPVADPTFWLLTKGWKQYGTIATREMPGPKS